MSTSCHEDPATTVLSSRSVDRETPLPLNAVRSAVRVAALPALSAAAVGGLAIVKRSGAWLVAVIVTPPVVVVRPVSVFWM